MKLVWSLLLASLLLTACTHPHIPLNEEKLLGTPMFTSLKDALASPQEVYRINLYQKNLKEIPHEIRGLEKLQRIDLSSNPNMHSWKKVLLQLGELKYLEEVNLENNNLRHLP